MNDSNLEDKIALLDVQHRAATEELKAAQALVAGLESSADDSEEGIVCMCDNPSAHIDRQSSRKHFTRRRERKRPSNRSNRSWTVL